MGAALAPHCPDPWRARTPSPQQLTAELAKLERPAAGRSRVALARKAELAARLAVLDNELSKQRMWLRKRNLT